MIVKHEVQVCCIFCRAEVTLREYAEIPGGLYTDHFCAEERSYILASIVQHSKEEFERAKGP